MNLEYKKISPSTPVYSRPYMMVLLTLLPLSISIILLYFNLNHILKVDIDRQKERTSQIKQDQIVSDLEARVDSAWDIAQHYYTEGLGQDACKKALNKFRFGRDNYVWVHRIDKNRSDSGFMLVHPDKNLVNKDLSGLIDLELVSQLYLHGDIIPKDSDRAGNIKPINLFEEFNKVCLENGSGCISYYWPKIVDGKAGDIGYLKLSYVKYFPEWDWILGAGAYADHVENAILVQEAIIEQNAREIWHFVALSFISVGLGVTVITFFATRAYARQLSKNEKNIRLAKEKASNNEQVFRTLIANLPQKILLKDKNSKFVYCNEKYAEGADLTIDQIIGKTDYDIYGKEIAMNYVRNDRQVLESDETTEIFTRYNAGGQENVTRVLKTPVKNETGSIEGILCVFEDFTERIHSEEALKKANEELQQSNHQLKEMQSQLVHSEKMASIGQLAAGIAHEINNPMGFVTSNFSTLEKYISSIMKVCETYDQFLNTVQGDGPFTLSDEIKKIQGIKEEEQIEYIYEDIPELFADSTEGMNRIIKIVKNLRDFSRIDQVEDFTYANLADCIQSTLVVSKNELKYSADIITDYADTPDIYCNSGQLNQVFLNILVNAAQAIDGQDRTGKGTVRINVSSTPEYVVCEITDDGPGIPEEYLSKVFDPFFTTKPAGKGTGLGLNLSYDIIVNKHKGKLSVDTELGKGTKFTIKIPVNLEKILDQAEETSNGYEENSLVC